jgi:hypothetical protein
MFQGAADQRCRLDFWLCSDTKPLSARNDVLVFQTPPLASDIEVTGRLIVKLWASSDALDTDFTAKLVDVYPPNADFPSGVDLNIADSIVRARYRNGFGKAELLKPGQPYEFTDRNVPDLVGIQAGPPHPSRHFKQQLPPLRYQPKHGRTAQQQPPLAGRRQHNLPGRKASLPDCLARHSSGDVGYVCPWEWGQ